MRKYTGDPPSKGQNYSITEKEMLSIIKTIQKYFHILYESKIQIFTDNRNNIFTRNLLTNRAQRWLLFLQNFDYKICHISGSENTAADFLSRSLMYMHSND